MRISDWSSDVCSSDLPRIVDFQVGRIALQTLEAFAHPLVLVDEDRRAISSLVKCDGCTQDRILLGLCKDHPCRSRPGQLMGRGQDSWGWVHSFPLCLAVGCDICMRSAGDTRVQGG